MSDTIEKLFKPATDCAFGDIHPDAGPGIQVSVLEEGGQRQSRLGSEEG